MFYLILGTTVMLFLIMLWLDWLLSDERATPQAITLWFLWSVFVLSGYLIVAGIQQIY